MMIRNKVKLENILFENGFKSLTLTLIEVEAINLCFRNNKKTTIISLSSKLSLNDIQFEKFCNSVDCSVIDIKEIQ